MPRSAEKRLLADYAAAVEAERAAWRLLNEEALSEPEQAAAYAQWQAAAALTRALAAKLKEAAIDPPAPPPAAG